MFFETLRNNAENLTIGRKIYEACPERKAGRCGKIPLTWTNADFEIWVDGCGKRSCCPPRRRVNTRAD